MREEQAEEERQEWEAVDSILKVEHLDKSSLTNNSNTEVRLACRLRILDLDPWEVQVDFISKAGQRVVAMVVIQSLANLEQVASKKIPALFSTPINSRSKKK